MTAPPVGYVLKMFPRCSETFVVNEILELERRGLEVVVYSLKPAPGGPRHAMLSRLRAEIVYLPDSVWRGSGAFLAAHARLLRRAPGLYARTLAHVLSALSWAAFKRFLQAGVLALDGERRGVRHLHAHFATAATRASMLVARLSTLTYSFTAHAKDIYLDSQNVRLLRQKLAGARFVVTVSDHNVAHLRRLCGADATRNVVRIYNGVDLAVFDGARRSRVPGSILCVARLVEKKGVGDLLDACAALARRGVAFSCRIVGDGPLRSGLERRSWELGLAERVRFLGPLPHEAVVRELRAAAVFALPCVIAADGNRDGLPTVILEAMAAGTPVVSTRVTGVPEMIMDRVSGLVVRPGDPESLAGALEQVLSDPSLAARIADAARGRVEERFALATNVGELYERLAAAAGPESSPRQVATEARMGGMRTRAASGAGWAAGAQ